MFLEIDFDMPVERGPRPRDRTPFRTAPRPGRDFGRKAPKAPATRFPLPGRRIVPLVGGALLAGDIVDGVVRWLRNTEPYPAPQGWRIHNTCLTFPPSGPNGPWADIRGTQVSNCSTGQAMGLNMAWPPFIADQNYDTVFLSDVSFGPARAHHRRDYWRNLGTVGGPQPNVQFPPISPYYIPMRDPMPNPNVERWSPAPQPVTPSPRPVITEVLGVEPQFEWQSAPAGKPPSPSHRSAPPRHRNVKEKKVQSRAAKIGIFLWQAFDNVSELSEIVDAFYDALPAEAKREAGCQGGRLGDKLGQYGIDAADCKAVALWENWDNLDARAALMGVMKNVMVDMSIGAMHQLLSKLYPPGISIKRTTLTAAINRLGLELAIWQALEDVFEAWDI